MTTTLSTRPTSRRERKKAQTRADLVKAAHALVREDGYEGLTIRKLAERVGYATMSVYSYFPDKHSILFAIAQDAFSDLARRMERTAPVDPLERLKDMMRADLVAELVAIESYSQMITMMGARDPATRRLFEDILADEQAHAEELQSWLAD